MNTDTRRFLKTVLVASALTILPARAAETVWLTELDLGHLHFEGWRKPQVDKSFSGKPLSIAGRKFERGVGTRALSTLWLELDGRTEKFLASVGVDDAAGNAEAAVAFTIIGDGKKLWESGVMKRGQSAKAVDVGLKGVRSLLLMVDHAGESNNYDHADWADARFMFGGVKPLTVNAPREEAVILTPKPPREPRINGPKVYGCRPGNPFIYRIPTTGERPIQFTADGLPASLHLDKISGIITGAAPERGTHTVMLRAKNRHGTASRALKIVSGDTLALTPPMGWNHWYAHYNRVTDTMMREAADVMVKSGMADVGYAYVNIDDCWMNAPGDAKRPPDPLRVGPFRDAAGNIIPNKHFPDMRLMTAYIHAKGLKAGIYTSPGPLTCGGYAGAYEHEEQDARLFAEWGFDFLKYDWCSYSKIAKDDKSLGALKKPYKQMGDILKKLPRDVVFNLCQYGMGNVWEWGTEIGGHCWRTAGDLGAELNRIFAVALKNAEYRQWSKPGAWNDPDYIQIGWIGDARTNGEPKPCPMTPTEQYSFMSLWCLSAAPLFYSGDMSRLDEFTLNVLCNPEVIEVDQDPLGECARVVPLTPETFLMVKNLEDGSKAVGLCNRGEIAASIVAKWGDIGVSGKQTVRDLWRQRDLGKFDGQFKATVPRHGVVLLRLRR
ncbi:MAG: NPCBM/NEW2 domain-containing protein [Verrucomicrobia bacterium]|nr:NPCBM/NEW2 domain-containing protein [Verrucomicrobiota bacterium]